MLVFLRESVVHLSVERPLFFDVGEGLAELRILRQVVLREEFLAIQRIRLRHWHRMLLIFASVFPYLQLACCSRLIGTLFLHRPGILGTRNRIIIICNHVLLIATVVSLPGVFAVLPVARSFAVSSHLAGIRHFNVANILILTTANDERSAGRRRADVRAEGLATVHASVLSTLQFGFI